MGYLRIFISTGLYVAPALSVLTSNAETQDVTVIIALALLAIYLGWFTREQEDVRALIREAQRVIREAAPRPDPSRARRLLVTMPGLRRPVRRGRRQ